MAFVDEVCRWRVVDEQSRSVRAVSIRDDVYASFDSSVGASVKDGGPRACPGIGLRRCWRRGGDVMSTRVVSTGEHAEDWTGPPLSGWARALTVLNGALVQVACEAAVLLRDGAVVRTLDAGPTTSDEEEWRRHDICALGSSSTYLAAGLVDGSLRRWSTEDWAMDVLPNALINRAVGVAVFDDGAVVACDAASARRLWTPDAPSGARWPDSGGFASFEQRSLSACTAARCGSLDAATLAPARSVSKWVVRRPSPFLARWQIVGDAANGRAV